MEKTAHQRKSCCTMMFCLYTKRCKDGGASSPPFHFHANRLLVKDSHSNGKRLKRAYSVKVNCKSIVFHLAHLFIESHKSHY